MPGSDSVRRFGYGFAAFVAVLLGTAPAPACTVCESETGRRVRAGIFNDEFGTNLILTLLPFAILFGIVALIHFGRLWPVAGARRTLSDQRGSS
jgi:hypothetical protein